MLRKLLADIALVIICLPEPMLPALSSCKTAKLETLEASLS